ncbi:hypothetical protein TNCT_58351 [Trichonephila clavata]|uniref:Uncharacterized protein n=1 Tax=Trichonephila clavata TaxID=2740835 RepID=A0A8X6G256_TRICU|nr:hypothetical protein TNCT_58351 [Trichonephila clavata]
MWKIPSGIKFSLFPSSLCNACEYSSGGKKPSISVLLRFWKSSLYANWCCIKIPVELSPKSTIPSVSVAKISIGFFLETMLH